MHAQISNFSKTNDFDVFLIIGDGNGLFRAISLCLFGNEDGHYEMRSVTVNNVINKWNEYDV